MLAANRKSDAVAILAWVATTSAQSANAYDSLAEALTAAGETKRADAAAAKSCELLPGDATLTDGQRKSLVQRCNK